MKYLKTYNVYEQYINDSIIFLDIDGVLNLLHIDTGKDEYGQIFSNECVEAFDYLIEKTNANIVIISTWKSSGLSIMKEMWINRELPGNVIDITPNEVDLVDNGVVDFYDMVDRGLEIEQWIKNNNFKGSYVIIDDVTDFNKEQMLHFVKTNPKAGLTMNDSEKAIKILKNK